MESLPFADCRVSRLAPIAASFALHVQGRALYDTSGNVAEWTRFGLDAPTRIYGGSHLDSQTDDLACDAYVLGTEIEAGFSSNEDWSDHPEIGFRCCSVLSSE